MDFPFQLKAWHAVAPRLHVREDWQRWAEHPEILTTLAERAPELAHVPALQRRRLSPAARLMFAAVHPPLAAHGTAPLVFVSHDGEMRRSFDLWRDLLVEGTVSPMSFGLSVHNALAGQWSLHSGDTAEHTALCAREAGLETAIVEACALLAEGAPQVLVVTTEDPPQGQYALPGQAPFPFALALLVTAGDSHRLVREAASGSPAPYWSALDWIRGECLQLPSQTLDARDARWHWNRR